jgi:hypothetical protein
MGPRYRKRRKESRAPVEVRAVPGGEGAVPEREGLVPFGDRAAFNEEKFIAKAQKAKKGKNR